MVTPEYQNNIWYIEFLDSWATTDKTGLLHIWDIQKNSVSNTISLGSSTQGDVSNNYKKEGKKQSGGKKMGSSSLAKKLHIGARIEQNNYIIDIAELSYLRLLVTASTDKQLRIWDMENSAKPKVLFCLNMVKGGVHQIVYFASYQVLLVAGYENSVPVFSITPIYNDLSVVGRLIGHLSIVTAIECMEGTPLVLTADDSGSIKTWDIRTLQCYQTIELSQRTVINQLICMENIGKLGFIGCRVNFLEFDQQEIRNGDNTTVNVIPIGCDINLSEKELVVCTRNDLRFYDLQNGRLKRILTHLISKEETDLLTGFKLIQMNRNILITDHKGNMKIFSYRSGELILALQAHTSAVSYLFVDKLNKLFLSIGSDSTMMIQREISSMSKFNKPKVEREGIEQRLTGLSAQELLKMLNSEAKLRQSKGVRERRRRQKQREIGSNDEEGSECDKEDVKTEVLRRITGLHSKLEVGIVALSVYHNLVATSSIDNKLVIYDYEFGKLIAKVTLDEGVDVTGMEFINGYSLLLVATSDKNLYMIDVESKEGTSIYLKCILICDPNLNIPARRENSRLCARLLKSNSKTSFNPYDEEEPSFVDKIVIDLNVADEKQDDDFESHKSQLLSCSALMALHSGFIISYDLTKFLLDRQLYPHANKKPNYNPYRVTVEDYISQIETSLTKLHIDKNTALNLNSMDAFKTNHFFAHKQPITSIKVIRIPKTYVVSTSVEQYLKMFTLSGELVSTFNLNHPLPLKWNLEFSKDYDSQNKILFSLKVIEAIFKRYYNMLYVEGKMFDLKKFLRQFGALNNKNQETDQESEVFNMTQVKRTERSTTSDIILLQDEYEPKDFASGKMKEYYRDELIGPNLRHMEAKRRIALTHNEWKTDWDQDDKFLSRIAQKNNKKVAEVNKFFDKFKDTPLMEHNELNLSDLALNVLESLNKPVEEIKRKQKNLSRKEGGLNDSLGIKYGSNVDGEGYKKHRLSEKRFQNIAFRPKPRKSKQEFFSYASQKNLILEPQKKIEARQVITSIERRQQNAIKANEDQKKFTEVLDNLNSKLKKSQISMLNGKRNLSLPQLQIENKEISKKLSNHKFGYLFGKRRKDYLKFIAG